MRINPRPKVMQRTNEDEFGRKNGHKRVHGIGNIGKPVEVHNCIAAGRFRKYLQVSLRDVFASIETPNSKNTSICQNGRGWVPPRALLKWFETLIHNR